MVNNKYFKILEENNNMPYAYYILKIKWNVKNIIGKDKNTDGYIVQKVCVTNTTGLNGLPEEEYYEAWKVVNGKIENPKKLDYDDIFSFYPSFLIEECKMDSLGKNGIINYKCNIYWINSKSKYYKLIELWNNEVLYACDLKSVYLKNIDYRFTNSLFTRNFIHIVNYNIKKDD